MEYCIWICFCIYIPHIFIDNEYKKWIICNCIIVYVPHIFIDREYNQWSKGSQRGRPIHPQALLYLHQGHDLSFSIYKYLWFYHLIFISIHLLFLRHHVFFNWSPGPESDVYFALKNIDDNVVVNLRMSSKKLGPDIGRSEERIFCQKCLCCNRQCCIFFLQR